MWTSDPNIEPPDSDCLSEPPVSPILTCTCPAPAREGEDQTGRLQRVLMGDASVSHLARIRARWAIALTIVLALPLGTLGADEPAASQQPAKTKEHFLRIERDPAGHPVALQTGVVRFESDAPARRASWST